MKYFVEGVVRCLAGIEVEADSYDEAADIARTRCLEAEPLLPPSFRVVRLSPVEDEPDSFEDIDLEEVDDVVDRIEENEKVCNDTKDEEPSEEEAVEEKIKKACCKLNKNKKCCGKCGKKPEIEGFMFVSDHPLIDLIESITGGDDEWDFV